MSDNAVGISLPTALSRLRAGDDGSPACAAIGYLRMTMHMVNPAFATFAIAVVVGLFAQVVGHRSRIPAIVPLLAFGVLFGPSGLDVLHPYALGAGLSLIVKFCVAVILFDGALNLRLGELRDAAYEVRR